MEIIFMVFMAVVSVMALFAIMVVFRDVVRETYDSRRERDKATKEIVAMAERIVAEANAKAEKQPCVCEQNADEKADAKAENDDKAVVEKEEEKPEVEEKTEAAEEEAVEEKAAIEEVTSDEKVEEEKSDEAVSEDDDSVNKAFADLGDGEAEEDEAVEEDTTGKISFSTGQQLTLGEKYLALTPEQKDWYDEIVKYAAAVEGSKCYRNARYEEYKVGKNRLVRMLIKRGVIHCEFILQNSDFKNYINENKISVKHAATTMIVDSEAAIGAVKNSVDIAVAAIAEEKEYKKQLAREKRKAARAAAAAGDAEETAEQ